MMKRIKAIGVSSLVLGFLSSGVIMAAPASPQGCVLGNPLQSEACLPVQKADPEREAAETATVAAPQAPSFAEQMNQAFDAWINGGDPAPAGNDNDTDMIPDMVEILLGTDPNVDEIGNGTAADADMDYIPDYADPDPATANNGLVDLLNDLLGYDTAATDSDSDGMADYTEIVLGTNPFDADSDHDGVDDMTDNFPKDPNNQKIVPPPGQGGGLQHPMWHWDNSGSDVDQGHGAESDGNESTDSNSGGTAGPGGGLTP